MLTTRRGGNYRGRSVVQYVKVCSIYGDGFYYIPGTDVCTNSFTGDTRQQTPGGTWRTFLPYPEGKWVTNRRAECEEDRLVHVGTFKSTDFTLNPWERKETAPVPLSVKPPTFISKVMMRGGFNDPRLPGGRSGVNGRLGLCLRSKDPDVFEQSGDNFINPPYGNGLLPLGCVANSRIVGMPATYVISAT